MKSRRGCRRPPLGAKVLSNDLRQELFLQQRPEAQTPLRLAFCIPVYNDWQAVALLLRGIDECARQWAFVAEILLVDDGSTEPPCENLADHLTTVASVEILRLHRNLGHQRAIAVGMAFIRSRNRYAGVVVMDGDGEDAPSSVTKLLERAASLNWKYVVFAKRRRRSEGIVFRFLYMAYRIFHRFLTGRYVEVGNFCIVPAEHLDALVVASETWNHFSAGVYAARIPVALVHIDRGVRLAGQSKMNLTSLFGHGLRALVVFGDAVAARLLAATVVMAAVSACVLIAGLAAVVHVELDFPIRSTAILAVLVLGLFMVLMVFLVLIMTAVHSIAAGVFIPRRDYLLYVDRVIQAKSHE
ncbi:MAG: glycosyltransferase [Desulfomonile sp.]|nr:glycosyltransferase [Desulfomonile sp.]